MRQLAMEMNKMHFDIHALFFRPNAEREKELQDHGVKTVMVPVSSYKSIDPLRAMLEVKRYLQRHDIQLVHAFDAPTCTLVVPAARLARTRVVLGSQRGNRLWDPKVSQWLRWLTDRLAHGIVVNGKDFIDQLERAGVPRSKMHFCPNGLDTDRFVADGRKRFPEVEDATVVLGCTAVHRPEKMMPFLVDAFAEIRRQRPGVKLVLAGNGPETPKVLARIEANQLGSDCVVIPHTPNTAWILRAIDLFLLTSATEGTPNSLMEAMACGTPVLASNVEGTRDLVEDGVNGFLFEYMNQADMVKKAVALIDHAALRQKIAAYSTPWIRETLGLNASARRMAAIYDQYLGKNGVH